MITRIRSRLEGSRESGLSLVEMLVAMLLTGIVLSLVGSLFVNVARVTTASNASTQKTGTAANAMNEMIKYIKGAANNTLAGGVTDPAFQAASPTAMTFYSYGATTAAKPAPTKVAFRFDGANLVEDTWTATDSSGYWVFSTTASSRVIGTALQTTGATPLFSYVLSDKTIVLDPTATLTAAQRKLIVGVTVTVTIANRAVSGDDPIVLVNTASLPNLIGAKK